MNKAEAAALGEEIRAAIAPLLEARGLELKSSRGTFGEASLDLKLSLAEKPPEGQLFNPKSDEAQAFTRWANLEGLKPEDLGRSFAYKGQRQTVIGLRQRARKRPILTIGENGKTLQWGSDSVRRLLSLEPSA